MTNGLSLSFAAGAVIGGFMLTALVLKLFHKMYTHRAEVSASLQAVQEGGLPKVVNLHFASDQGAFDEKQLEEGSRGASKLSSEVLSSKPQTPLELFQQRDLALQRASSPQPFIKSRQIHATMDISARYGIRPQSSSSSRSAWSDGMLEDPPRPQSAPTVDEMRKSERWAEVRDWWPEVASNWESPYSRPSSRNSNQRPRRQPATPSPDRSECCEDGRPSASSKLHKTGPGQIPFSEAYGEASLWTQWGALSPDLQRAKTDAEAYIKFTVGSPSPPPLPSTFCNSAQDGNGMSWATVRPRSVERSPNTDRSRPVSSTPAARQIPVSSAARPAESCKEGVPQKPNASLPPRSWLLDWFDAGKPDPAKVVCRRQAESRMESMLKQLESTRGALLPERKRVFRELQRQLHPDKNVDCAEEAKMAFQELMQQRAFYLRP